MSLSVSRYHPKVCSVHVSTPTSIATSTIYLDNGSCINISCAEKVVQHAKYHRTTEHQAAVIHRCSCWMVHGGPQAKEKDDDEVDNCEAVRHYTKDTRNTPRAPSEFFARNIGEYVSRAGVKLDVAAETSPEKEHSDDEVGAEEADDGEGDDVVESGGRAKHDEGKNTGQDRSQEDGEYGNCGFGIDTLDLLPTGNSSIAGKSPELPRGRCDNTDGGAE